MVLKLKKDALLANLCIAFCSEGQLTVALPHGCFPGVLTICHTFTEKMLQQLKCMQQIAENKLHLSSSP